MIKFLLIILISAGCQGCSFIQEKFGSKPQQNQEENQGEQRESKPIPVDPQHS